MAGTCVQDTVHPRVMEQIVSCRDDIAQQYLMQVSTGLTVHMANPYDCFAT